MQASLRTLALVIVCLQVAGCAAMPSATAASHPLAGALVSATLSGGDSPVATASTNSTGGYQLSQGLAAGSYEVQAWSYGYVSSAQQVNVSTTSEAIRADFSLARSAVVTGRVMGFDGRTVAGAIVTLVDANSGLSIASAYTDSDGVYVFGDGVANGTYSVSVDFQFPFEYGGSLVLLGGNYTEPDFSYVDVPTVVPGYLSGSSVNVTAVEGSSVTVPDVVLGRSAVVGGRITDTSGRPIANASLNVASAGEPSHIFVTDSSGQFTAAYDIGGGNVSLTPYAFGYAGAPSSLSVVSGGTANVSIQMTPSAKLAGYVVRQTDGQAVPGAFINLRSVDGNYNQVALTGSDGSYAISTGLGPGDYTLSLMLGVQTLSNSLISFSAGQLAQVNMTVDVFFVSGKVSATGAPTQGVDGADVSLTYAGPPGSAAYASTSLGGYYMLVVPVIPGTRGQVALATLTASAPGFNDTVVPLNLTIGNDLTQNVMLVASGTGNQTGGPSATIQGTVTAGDGASLPYSMEWWHVPDSAGPYLIGVNSSSSVVDVNGGSAAGIVTLSLEGPVGSPGQTTISLPSAFYVGPFTASSDSGASPTIVSQGVQGTYYVVTVTYGQRVQVLTLMQGTAVPEFPGWIALASVGSAIAVALLWEKLTIGDRSEKPRTDLGTTAP